MHIKLPRIPLPRQLLGAMLGALLALVLYQAYAFASPLLASLLPQRETQGITSETKRADTQDRIVAQARRTLEQTLPQGD